MKNDGTKRGEDRYFHTVLHMVGRDAIYSSVLFLLFILVFSLTIIIALTMNATAIKPYYNPSYASAPAMDASHPSPGSVSGRLTTSNTSAGLPNAYVAIVNASNLTQAFYETTSDANGFYVFPIVNNTWVYDPIHGTGSPPGIYKNLYKVYGNHSLFGEGFSNSFPVEEHSTAPANVVIIPQPNRIVVTAERNNITANSSDKIKIYAYATDAFGDPVADGTHIDFAINATNYVYNANGSLSATGDFPGTFPASDRWFVGDRQTKGGWANVSFGWVDEMYAGKNSTINASYHHDHSINGTIDITIKSASTPTPTPIPTPTPFPRPVPTNAPPMISGHMIAGAVSGRVTTDDTSVGIPNAFVAIINAYNARQAYYVGHTDANGYYQFANVNNTYNGTAYPPKYMVYADQSSFGYGYSASAFSVEQSSTAPANVVIQSGPTPSPLPVLTKAPPMQPGYQQTGAISGRVTTYNTSVGIANTYVAIVNACNTNEVFYIGQSDANGFFQFASVNNTFDGSHYQSSYKVFAGNFLYVFSYSNSFPVEMSSTSPANVVLVDWNTPDPTPTPTILHYPSKDIQVIPAPAMASSKHAGAVSGRLTTSNTSCGLANTDILIVNAANTLQAFYVGKSDSNGYYQFVGVNTTYNSVTGTYDNRYKIYAYNSTFGECYSNAFPVEEYSTAPANVVVIPLPSHVVISQNKSVLVANGSDNLSISAYLTDSLGDPVADGTHVYFIINNGSTYDAARMGHWGSTSDRRIELQTKNGYAQATYGWIPSNSIENYVNLSVVSPDNNLVNASVNATILADPASIVWSRNYSAGLSDITEAIAPATDGYVVTGYVYYNNSTERKQAAYLLKTDLNGNLLWNKTYETPYNSGGSSVIAVHDGYVITGFKNVNGSNYDVYLFKTDLNGSMVWIKTYGGASYDTGNSVITENDGYMIVGMTYSSTNHNGDVYVIKTDLNGNRVWEKTYGGISFDLGSSIAAMDDGYIVTGYTLSYGHGSYDVYLLKIDKAGNLLWEKTYGGAGSDSGSAVLAISDGYVIAGTSASFSSTLAEKVYLLKTDLGGNLLWQKTYGGNDLDDGLALAAASDGYAIVGATNSYSTGLYAVYLVKTDLYGNLVRQMSFGRGFADIGVAVVATNDSFVIAGSSITPELSVNTLVAKVDATAFSPVTPCPASYTYTLYEGWNLISIPVELSDYNLSSVFPADVMYNVTSIWGWNESSQSWIFYSYDPNDKYYKYLPPLTQLKPGKAYWIQMDKPGSFTVQGTVPAYAPAIQTVLDSKWNFVGTTGMSSLPITSIYPDAVSIWSWNGETQGWEIYCFDPYHRYYKVVPDLTTAYPGKGYWVQMD